MKGGSKYQALQRFLQGSDRGQVTLTFAKIEKLIETSLPASARTQRAWWSNRSKGALQATAWMEAGFLVKELDLAGERVTFYKPPAVYKVQRVDDVVQWNGELIRALRLHMGMTQSAMAKKMGVRQQTISEWEKGRYIPTKASANYLTLVAEKASFKYEDS